MGCEGNNKTKDLNSCCSSLSCCNNFTKDISVSNHLVHSNWIKNFINTSIGKVSVVSTRLTFSDVLGSWKARWGFNRMNYKVNPGLYAVGNPDSNSPVLVSANYKMSFDRLRRELTGLSLWILVLDTKGINVWCAAGKGTFGTEELVKRIIQVKLPEIITHRTLIVPQLGAVGIAAHLVSKFTGFKIVYGPVQAKDISVFLKSGLKATLSMRQIHFGFKDRLVLTPMELVGTVKSTLILIAVLFVINLIGNVTTTFYQLIIKTIYDFIPFLGSILAGALFVPLLLPYIPGRALAWKGWLLGVLWTGVYLYLTPINWLQAIIYLLFLPPIASYLAMNFTGATTYTSLSGVVKEIKAALPAQIISILLGFALLIGKLFIIT